MKKNKWIHIWLTFCTIIAVVIASTIIYAEGHPNTKIHQIVVNLGFHLKK